MKRILFACGLLKEALSTYLRLHTFNYRIISEWRTGRDIEQNGRGPLLRFNISEFTLRREENYKNFSQDSYCHQLRFELGISRMQVRTLQFEQICLLRCTRNALALLYAIFGCRIWHHMIYLYLYYVTDGNLSHSTRLHKINTTQNDDVSATYVAR